MQNTEIRDCQIITIGIGLGCKKKKKKSIAPLRGLVAVKTMNNFPLASSHQVRIE